MSNVRSKTILMFVIVCVISVSMAILAAGCGDEETTTTAAPTQTTAAPTETTAAPTETTAAPTETTAAPTETTGTGPATGEPIKVGAVNDETGAFSGIGLDTRDGVRLEIEKLNAEGGINGHPIELVAEDTASDAAKANAAFVKLTAMDDVPIIVGPSTGAVVAQAMAVVEREKTPLIAFVPDPAAWDKQFYKYTFNLVPNSKVGGQTVMAVAKHNDYKSIVVVTDVEAFFFYSAYYCRDAGEAWGIKTTLIEDQIIPGQLDMTAFATKVKAACEANNADAIGTFLIGSDAITLVKALKKIGVNIPIIGNSAFGYEGLMEAGGADVEGVQFITDCVPIASQLPEGNPQRAIVEDQRARWEAAGIDRPYSAFAGHGYAVVEILKRALTNVGWTDKDAIRDYIENNTKDLLGTEGTITYTATDHQGIDLEDFHMMEVKDGKFVLIPVNPATYIPADLPEEFK